MTPSCFSPCRTEAIITSPSCRSMIRVFASAYLIFWNSITAQVSKRSATWKFLNRLDNGTAHAQSRFWNAIFSCHVRRSGPYRLRLRRDPPRYIFAQTQNRSFLGFSRPRVRVSVQGHYSHSSGLVLSSYGTLYAHIL